jgi:predicted RNA-binding protein YlqC (UPF0109 family)
MKELVEHMARALVENPDGVSVEESTREDMTVYEIKVDEAEVGRVIGKKGRIKNAMIVIIRSAAARHGQKATIEIID